MEEVKKEEGQKANILEVGEYQIDGPENGDISFAKEIFLWYPFGTISH